MTQVYDLHCDLLSFLAGGATKPVKIRSAYDECCRSSIPQLMKGGVRIQTMAIYTPTRPWSVRSGLRQAAWYQLLSEKYRGVIAQAGSSEPSDIKTRLAIENASGFISETEPLQLGLDRLEDLANAIEVPSYISLTWNEENRFGGGAHAPGVGLKPDGRTVIDWAARRGVAIDLSHTSDHLGCDILEYTQSVNCKVIASHSNFRDICDVPRNLPKEFALEVACRGGIIGLNFIKPFVGATSDFVLKHIEYAHQLGIEDSLCIGADFYSELCVPRKFRKDFSYYFFEDLANSSCYPELEERVAKSFGKNFAHKIFFRTASKWDGC